MRWSLSSRTPLAGVLAVCVPLLMPASARGEDVVGVPWTGQPGITETVAEIMARERLAPRVDTTRPRPSKPEVEFRRQQPLRQNPGAAAVSRWPMIGPRLVAPRPYNPQTVGTNFLGSQLLESGFIPPDSMGDVGPTQILVAINGRIKVFDKTGVLGSLNVTMDTFFNSVRGGVGVSDPHVRYDRLSGHWFVTIVNVPAQGPNRVLIAVSSGPTITNTASFTFFQFQQDAVGAPGGDLNGFADYDTLGVDKFALYIGVNIFNQAGNAFLGTTGFVVNKANLIGGTLTVTAFRQMAGNTCPGAGPYAPQGVNNDDPAATQGYFAGVDICLFGLLQVRRVNNPGGAPTLSGNLAVSVPATSFPIDQVQPGGAPALDALDDRLFAVAIHRNKITGLSTLWTAHNIQVDSGGAAVDCFPSPSCPGGRNGSRWYEIGSLTATPALVQSGTLFDPAASNPFGYWIPSVAMSGQGHMALGASRASAVGGTGPASGHASISVAGRLGTDALGTTQAPTLAVDSDSRYDTSDPGDPERWGDYSQVGVDPNDDMTMWTFQEYAIPVTSYGVRAIKLVAPPPATPNCGVPATVTNSPQNVTITGTSSAGSGFFDPGPDTGGPGYTRLTAGVSPGVIVNSVTFNSPTSVTLNVSTSSNGTKDVTLTNPDGQSVVGTGCIVVNLQADLSITKTDGKATTGAGSPVTYTITVGNAGPAGVTGASVVDNFPASLTGVTWTCTASAGSSCAAPSGSGNINQTVNVLVGGIATFVATGTLNINASGTLANTATVSSGIPDPNPANNSATDTDTIIPAADLSITKTDGRTTASIGDTIIYTIVASNAGPTIVTGATVADTIPASLTGATWTCVGAGGGTCAAGGSGDINDTVNLPVGATVTYTLTATVSPTATSLSNTATITAPASVNDPNAANNTATDTDILVCGSVVVVVPDGRLTQATVGVGATAWFGASLKIGDSYSVEFKNTTGGLPPGTLTVYKGDDICSAGTTLTTNDTSAIDPSGTGGLARASFTATGTQTFFQAKLVNTTGGPLTVTFGWSDTSQFSATWSTGGSFDTFYSFLNTTGVSLSGTLTLFDTAGVTIGTFPVTVPAGQTSSVNTSSLGVPRNRTGTAKFTHNGPPGAILAEAAVANFSLNPAYVQPVKFQPMREAK
jgi:uncharacterized repeat protein (TIGR01451 family)